MQYTCFHCNATFTFDAHSRIGRRDTCETCGADLHCCRNCKHYDPRSYNECNEPQAERVLEKERANFCDYFSLRAANNNMSSGPTRDKKQSAKAKLEDLFK